MDPILSKLNDAIQKSGKSPSDLSQSPLQSPEGSPFQNTFDNKIMERMLEKVKGEYGANAQNQMTVLSADNIHVQTNSVEGMPNTPEGKDKFFDMFKQMNRDLLGLDSAIETLSTPGITLSPRQLLAFQAGIGQVGIMAEGVSKAFGAAIQNIQQILQTQV